MAERSLRCSPLAGQRLDGRSSGERVNPKAALRVKGLTRDRGCWVVFMLPFLKPLMPQTHTNPGFRLGPDLPNTPSCIFFHTQVADLAARQPLVLACASVAEIGLKVPCAPK